MSNRIEKPMLTSKQLVRKKRDDKGITFKYVTEEKAEEYLTNVNNYMRTASYRQNYQKYLQGTNKGKYIELDFAYLQELSTIDMHFRFLVSRMCIDIEQALKVKLIRDIGEDNLPNGYDIVEAFLSKNPFVVSKLEAAAASPFTGDLICKYFTIHNVFNSKKNKYDRKIVAYDDCPVWVLLNYFKRNIIQTVDFCRKIFYNKINIKKLHSSFCTGRRCDGVLFFSL